MSLPSDLQPIPSAPWDERPLELPLDVQECRTALWLHRGNITGAAKTLKVDSKRLRRFIKSNPYLSEELTEAQERIVDAAEDNVWDALNDDQDPGRRDSMSRFVLASIGRERGWGTNKNGGLTVNSNGGPVTITWGDGSSVAGSPEQTPGDDAKVIEHE
jgi:hypothetical protein